MTAFPTAPVVAAGLVGGYASARHGGRDDVATLVFTGAGAWCLRAWRRRADARTSAGLSACYLLAFYLSHPLAKKIGGWPAVLAMSMVATGVTFEVADRPSQATGLPAPRLS